MTRWHMWSLHWRNRLHNAWLVFRHGMDQCDDCGGWYKP